MENVDLFGNKIINIKPTNKRCRTLFGDYDGFVKKFENKKTTDDCYTPPEVFNIILRYVAKKADISGLDIIRPFYPGGDYENVNYPINSVVIDNPPFSILSKIARFYIKNEIKFFLFAPHLTLFSANIDCTAIVCGADIEYENGAKIKTSFLTNMFGDIRVLGDYELYNELMEIYNSKKVNLPKYKYPESVLTVSMVHKYVTSGIAIQFNKDEVYHCGGLDSQKAHKKVLFGSGFLLSEKAIEKKATAEKATAEKNNVIIWELSERERNIIKSLK